jgi:ABC-type phosphate transport system permease subunit
MERGLIMLLHSILIGVFIYIFMVYFGQPQLVAENRSLLLSALILVYMILFGHGLPNSINKNLF